MTKFNKILLAISTILICWLEVAAGVTLRVQGSGRGGQIGVGDKFYITYTVTNVNGEPQKPASVPGGKVIYFDLTGQSSSFTSINGKTSQSVSYTYTATCRAEKEGTYHFGPVTVGSEKSNTISYTIVSAAAASQAQSRLHSNSAASQANSGSHYDPYSTASRTPDEPKYIGRGNDKLFLRASLDKTTAYEQEALVYTVKLYSTYAPIKFIGATEAPKFDGFVIEESDAISKQLTYETYQGRQYATAVIARYIIFPQIAGKLTIKGNTYTVSTDEQEYYQDPYFSTMTVRRPIQLNVAPNDLTVTVNKLPTPKPADFSGGVGEFKIESSLKDEIFKTNQAASIVYTIKGSGNLKYIHMPDLSSIYPKQIDIYSPEVDVEARTGASNVSGTSVYDYSFMPLEAGEYEIPAVALSYFNPKTGRYEKSVAKGYTIRVGQGKGSVKSQTKSHRSFDRELMPVGTLSFERDFYVVDLWYWLCYIIPAVVLAFIVWYYRKLVALRADELGMRSRKAGKVATRRLRRARDCMRKNDTGQFYEEMLKALWGYVGDKLKMPTSELNRENVASRLAACGVPEELSRKFIGLVDECEFAKYSSNNSSLSLEDTYNEGAEVINSIEGVFGKKKESAVKEENK